MQNLSEELVEKATLINELIINFRNTIAENLHTPMNPERLLKCPQSAYDSCFFADIPQLQEALARDTQSWQANLEVANQRADNVSKNYEKFLAEQQNVMEKFVKEQNDYLFGAFEPLLTKLEMVGE